MLGPTREIERSVIYEKAHNAVQVVVVERVKKLLKHSYLSTILAFGHVIAGR
jgi:hypothetical protein